MSTKIKIVEATIEYLNAGNFRNRYKMKRLVKLYEQKRSVKVTEELIKKVFEYDELTGAYTLDSLVIYFGCDHRPSCWVDGHLEMEINNVADLEDVFDICQIDKEVILW